MSKDLDATVRETDDTKISFHELTAKETIIHDARSSCETFPSLGPEQYRWRPSFWRVRPLLGMLAIFFTLLSLTFSLLILINSNGQSTAKWTIQPTVYLAAATAISNASLQCALACAAPVSWLYNAWRGSTIEDLEINWEASQSFIRAFIKSIKYKRTFGLLSIASLATALVLIDGPLLQRSVSVTRETATQKIQFNVSIVDQLPQGFSGTQKPLQGYQASYATVEVTKAHFGQQAIRSMSSCNGTCSTVVRAPGVAVMECANRTSEITEPMLRNSNLTWGFSSSDPFWGEDYYPAALKPVLFSSLGSFWSGCVSGREPLWVATGHANYEECEGSFEFANCTLVPAIVDHEIVVTGNVVSSTSERPRIVALANNSCDVVPDSSGTGVQLLSVANIVNMVIPYVASAGRLGIWYPYQNDSNGPVEVPRGSSFNAFSMEYLDRFGGSGGPCSLSTRDPMDDIITALNQIMLRAGFLAASWPNITEISNPGVQNHQVVQARWSMDENIFHSDLKWFFGAATIQLLAILLICPTFYGWWEIGVELSLSPFHICKLLDAPILSKVNSAAGAIGVIKEIGRSRLKLGGVVMDDLEGDLKLEAGPRTRIGIADSDHVFKPQRGVRPTN